MQERAEYSDAIGRKYPEAVVIAVVRDGRGVPNPITLGWSMVASHRPPMLAISVAPQRYSCECIRRSREFVVSFPSREMARDALFYGTRSGRDLEKIRAYGTATDPCARIDGVIFRDAVANFECRLAGELEAGDHVIFTGEVVQAWVHTEKKERLYTLASGYRMGGVAPVPIVDYHPSLFEK